LPTKKLSWVFLIFFFIFDAVVSYYGVKYLHGHEADFLIAPLVEKYPILYFPIIPLLFIIMFLIVKTIKKVAAKILKKTDENLIERTILGATVIYWAVGNSSANLVFLLGFRMPNIWLYTTSAAIPVTLFYLLYMIFQVRRSD
jgi:hypothetical protein